MPKNQPCGVRIKKRDGKMDRHYSKCYPSMEREMKGMLASMRFDVEVCLFGL
jgi:hypothetical protein